MLFLVRLYKSRKEPAPTSEAGMDVFFIQLPVAYKKKLSPGFTDVSMALRSINADGFAGFSLQPVNNATLNVALQNAVFTIFMCMVFVNGMPVMVTTQQFLLMKF